MDEGIQRKGEAVASVLPMDSLEYMAWTSKYSRLTRTPKVSPSHYDKCDIYFVTPLDDVKAR